MEEITREFNTRPFTIQRSPTDRVFELILTYAKFISLRDEIKFESMDISEVLTMVNADDNHDNNLSIGNLFGIEYDHEGHNYKIITSINVRHLRTPSTDGQFSDGTYVEELEIDEIVTHPEYKALYAAHGSDPSITALGNLKITYGWIHDFFPRHFVIFDNDIIEEYNTEQGAFDLKPSSDIERFNLKQLKKLISELVEKW